MFGGNISLGRILGIPLTISYSWFIILALVTFLLANQMGGRYPDWMANLIGEHYPIRSTVEQWLIGATATILFFVSVLVHELSHSILAINRGIPVNGITLFIFGGISHIGREARTPLVEFIIAAVGPLSSFILGGIFFALTFAVRDFSPQLAALAITLAFINVSLALFNLLPGFPLDGGRVLRSIIWGITGDYWRSTFLAARGGQVVAGLMIVGGLAMLLLLREFQGIWLAAIGWFLAMAAGGSLSQFKLRKRLDGYRAEDLMATSMEAVPLGISLETLATEYVLQSRQDVYFVMRNEQVLGMITFRAASRVPRNQWSMTTVDETMMQAENIPVIPPEVAALQAMELIESRRFPVVLVMKDGQLLGYVTQKAAMHNLDVLESMN